MNSSEFLCVGKIVGIHGIRGTVRVYSHSGDIAEFSQGNTLFLRAPKGDERVFTIEWCKPHGRHFLLGALELDSREQAAAVVGYDLFALRASLPPLEDDTYYWEDLIGLAVFDQKTLLGRITSIIPTPGNDVYVVTDADTGKETMVPALKSVVGHIDLAAGTMEVTLPEFL